MNMTETISRIDYTALKMVTTWEDILSLCEEAKKI